MKSIVMSLMMIAVLGIGSISCEMGSSFDEVVVDNSVQDQTSPDPTDDEHLPIPGGD